MDAQNHSMRDSPCFLWRAAALWNATTVLFLFFDVCLYTWRRPEDGGEAFWVTLHYEQKHPEFLLRPEEFARSNVRWKPQTRVRMFWRDDEHPAGGE